MSNMSTLYDGGPVNPNYYSVYGPDANCTLSVCSVKASVYEYRPSIAANAVFLVLYSIALIVHLFQGFKYRTFGFTFCMGCGCITEIIGYGGRIMLWQNPFSFSGFLMQISMFHGLEFSPVPTKAFQLTITVCITFGPTFYTAAIYFTLSKMSVSPFHKFGSFPNRSHQCRLPWPRILALFPQILLLDFYPLRHSLSMSASRWGCTLLHKHRQQRPSRRHFNSRARLSSFHAHGIHRVIN